MFSDNAPDRKKTKSFPYLKILILLVGFGFRVIDSSSRALWFDEAVEYLTASSNFNQLPAAIVASNYQPPLLTYLLHVWLKISIHPLWIRMLFISLSMLTLVGIMRWATLHWGNRGGLIAGMITAVLPTEIYYAQDVGEYALLVCLLTYSLFFLDQANRKSLARYWFLWAILTVGAIFTHYGAAIIVLPTSLTILLRNIYLQKWSNVKQQVMLSGISGLTMLPLVFYFLPQQIQRVSKSALANPLTSTRQELINAVSSVGQTFSYQLTGWPLSQITQSTSMIIVAIVVILAIIFSIPNWRKSPVLWLLPAYAFYFILVRLGLYIGFGFRYALIFTPMLVMTLAWILVELYQSRTPILRWLIFVSFVSMFIYATPHPTFSKLLRNDPPWSPQENLHVAFNYWNQQRRDDEATFVYYGAVPAMRYYLQLSGLDTLPSASIRALVECSAKEALPVCQENRIYFSSWVRDLTVEEKYENMLETMGNTPQRVWLLFSHVHATEESDLVTYLQGSYEIIDQFHDFSPPTASAYLFQRQVP